MTALISFYEKFWISVFIFTVFLSKPGKTQDAQFQDPQNSETTNITNLSEVEFLSTLSQLIDRDNARLEKFRRDSSRIEPIFQEMSLRFNKVVNQLDSIQFLKISPSELVIKEQELTLLSDVLDFLLERRRSVHQQIKILQRKIDKEQEVLDYVMKGEMAILLDFTEQTLATQTTSILPSDSVRSNVLVGDTVQKFSQIDPNEYNWKIVEAERELSIRKAKFQIARKSWSFIEELLALNKDELSIAKNLAQNANKQLTEWNKTLPSLEENLTNATESDSIFQIQDIIQLRINESKQLREIVAKYFAADTLLVNTLEARISRLSSMQEPLINQIADASSAIERQTRKLEYLRSPLAPHRIYSFVITTGPRIILIILIMVLIWSGGRWLTTKVLKGVIRYKSKEDREERIETLSRAIRSGLTIIMLFIGFMTIMSELGINVSVLLGGAAVFSLAIAFGAQTLVKDYFSGFMILSENQYRVGNVIKINNVSGVVEDISLRTTILRDLEGVAHFIPHGEISTVSNLTHGWSRVALDIGIAYKENVDYVMKVIMEIARGMQEDLEYKNLITGDPEMLGVDALNDSAVVIKLLIKTRPLRQWTVKREFLRRLKNRFDDLDIEIPFPHRTLYHRDLHLSDDQQDSGRISSQKSTKKDEK